MKLPNSKNHRAFTLIELLVVIVIISTLAVVVYVALDPIKRIKDSRDARRVSDTQSILTAVHQYIVDNKGDLPDGLSSGMSEAQLGTAASGCTVSTGGCSVSTAACVDLSGTSAGNIGKYLKEMPVDPQGTAAETGYSIVVDSNNIVTIKACLAENTTISVSR